MFSVVIVPLRFTLIPKPGLSGFDGLTVATSTPGAAFGSIICRGGRVSGMVQAVSAVARVSTSGAVEDSCVQTPSSVFPSALTRPSQTPSFWSNDILMRAPVTVIALERTAVDSRSLMKYIVAAGLPPSLVETLMTIPSPIGSPVAFSTPCHVPVNVCPYRTTA